MLGVLPFAGKNLLHSIRTGQKYSIRQKYFRQLTRFLLAKIGFSVGHKTEAVTLISIHEIVFSGVFNDIAKFVIFNVCKCPAKTHFPLKQNQK